MITFLVWLTGAAVGGLMFSITWICAGNLATTKEKKRLLGAVRKFVNHPDNRRLLGKIAVKIHHIIELISKEDFERAKRELRVLGIPF